MNRDALDAAALRKILSYDPETGVLTWIKPPSRLSGTAVAGTIRREGYRSISIRGYSYPAHHLAWLHFYGSWAPNNIDHINRVRDDNRVFNLRESSWSQGVMNRAMSKNNTSGYRGVYRPTKGNGWQAAIGHQRKVIYLGYYPTAEEAAKAYDAAAELYHGEFASLNFPKAKPPAATEGFMETNFRGDSQ
ncbi:HNH endonuclease signature motif containing protein [Xanthomonas campestris]|uniref:HNH endonuclease signature motif containing protein n=1 Tax=Xanthomonas campestris TaxID=339 RepID=UPI002368A233|nr:HNH endonuclease signature motif containing protein [Xanthomonas campestris]WDI91916.1 HNH endonuclease [Xanthomonas campestris]